ncbi:hypothetical protein SAMN02745857_03112 [Andreprevotia lacus DSM 23236]|uniref:SUKH-3 immunity protein n=1 Tax=Andreprevotia lacus DSM 23236 TaxID=1121001 RepID=A0A1W1XVU6_9NEIS|nr:hypothetical protein [Andreprevotia lacus]SMC28089.1 hypothetical protein SAMN02745857_03112 [Andreprevotia lacus DSM 23236]
MLALPELIIPLFRTAGWRPSAAWHAGGHTALSAADAARHIVDEFNGLCVGSCGPGVEQAAGDVRFLAAVPVLPSGFLAPWQPAIGEVCQFACAHHDHMMLFAGAGERYYIFTDPDERLYAAGNDFGELMRILLWGYRFGPEIARRA